MRRISSMGARAVCATAATTTTTTSSFAALRTCSTTPEGAVKMATPDGDAKIAEMAKLYSQMTLKEISTLQRAIFKELGHSDDFYEQALLRGMGGGGGGGVAVAMPAGGAAAAAGAAGAGGAAGEAPAEEKKVEKKAKAAEKTSFDVVLGAYPPEAKIKLVKEVRTACPMLSIKEAKDAVDKSPGPVAKALNKEDAEKLKKVMEGLGAKIELQ